MSIGSPNHVFYDPRSTTCIKHLNCLLIQLGVFCSIFSATRICLAGRTRMDRFEVLQRWTVECVTLHERERVMRLWFDVHSHYVKPSPVVPHGRATGAAEEIEQTRSSGQRDLLQTSTRARGARSTPLPRLGCGREA